MKIAMISDFFAPRLGGVENHILNLSKELSKLGHTIIIITNSSSGGNNICYVDGFKTYYLNLFSLFSGSIFPTIICSTIPIVQILLYEQIDLVHGHQCSTLPIEGILHSRILGIPTCFTNHSLVTVESLGGIVTQPMFQLCIKSSDGIICVSGATKDNTADRLSIHPDRITVIPNAVTEEFKPKIIPNPDTIRNTNPDITRILNIRQSHGWTNNEIIISVVSRLTTRKGSILLSDILPSIFKINPLIRLIIAGDGDKKELLEHTVDKYKLKDKVKFLGGIHPSSINLVLNQSNLFLNTSLTDAFCISIIEAAACGLYVVSTNVDGISEVLPKDMITLVNPSKEGILNGIIHALPIINQYNKDISHKRVHLMYKWSIIANNTNKVYNSIINMKRSKDRSSIRGNKDRDKKDNSSNSIRDSNSGIRSNNNSIYKDNNNSNNSSNSNKDRDNSGIHSNSNSIRNNSNNSSIRDTSSIRSNSNSSSSICKDSKGKDSNIRNIRDNSITRYNPNISNIFKESNPSVIFKVLLFINYIIITVIIKVYENRRR
ncbi:phosphatidylinositol N-acetylglucosaminyltransferase subunit A [Nematocida sp. AWRm78]|nr:phosphatidylinositol N-acetylglucosaminyltransferase subunit A [Nematocida sp. AWRm79]KAI5184467.1 phosphatidylinositol N-acetylglucosaminyltransferase subunit A [Nematocida sp. AWRm78]